MVFNHLLKTIRGKPLVFQLNQKHYMCSAEIADIVGEGAIYSASY